MNAVGCPRCGRDVPVPEGPASEAGRGGSFELRCPACDSRLELSIVIDGAETLIQPQLLPGGAEPAARPPLPEPVPDPGATVALGSGTALLDPDAGSDERDSVATVARASLILVGGAPGNERFTLSELKTTVGREGTDIVIADPAMSGRHFEIEARGGEYFVRDLKSSNGTFLNGDRIRAAELASGDRIRAGQSTLTFRVFETIAIE